MDEQKTQPIAAPVSPARADQQTTADTQPLPQYSQYGESQYRTTQYPPAVRPPQYQQNSPVPAPKRRERRPFIIAVIAVVAIVAGCAGACIYHDRHERALADCRNAVSAFTKVRKELLDTGDSSTRVQQLLREVLGVSDILDAAADASSSAEHTVSTEGCAANATITQLNLVKDTVASATDSLRKSIDDIAKDASKLTTGDSSQHDSGSSTGRKSTGSDTTDSSNADDGNDSTLEQSRKDLQSAIDDARDLLSQLEDSELSNTLKQAASSALNRGLEAAQHLADDHTVTDSHAYETAKSTLEQAISTARQWLESRAANR